MLSEKIKLSTTISFAQSKITKKKPLAESDSLDKVFVFEKS